jgi:hypothetical protein
MTPFRLSPAAWPTLSEQHEVLDFTVFAGLQILSGDASYEGLGRYKVDDAWAQRIRVRRVIAVKEMRGPVIIEAATDIDQCCPFPSAEEFYRQRAIAWSMRGKWVGAEWVENT